MNALEKAALRRRLARSKHRWLKACALFTPLKDSPMLMRLVVLLWDLFNTEHGYAYPSRLTLAKQLRIDPTNVSHALNRLSEGDKRHPGLRIIYKIPLRDVPEDLREAMRRDPRGRVYALNFKWAEDVLSGRKFIPEPDHDEWIEAAE